MHKGGDLRPLTAFVTYVRIVATGYLSLGLVSSLLGGANFGASIMTIFPAYLLYCMLCKYQRGELKSGHSPHECIGTEKMAALAVMTLGFVSLFLGSAIVIMKRCFH